MNEYEEYQSYQQPQEPRQPDPVMPEYQTPHSAPEKPKKKHKAAGIIALALCFSLIGGTVGAGGVMLAQRMSLGGEQYSQEELAIMVEGLRKSSQLETVTVDSSKEMTPAEVYAANVNSTVGITTSITTNFWGFQTTSAASGSGFIITTNGYILTNYHVIEDSNSITVSMYDGTTYDAVLVGYDESNDIAVLKIDAENLTPVVLGDSDAMNVGDSVVAIGNPLGELTFSLTSGAISAMDREITLSGGITMDLMQTDCAINSGNSGGALFNMYGEVIGVTNAKYSSSSSSEASIDNIGFAIPINSVKSIVQSIIENGYIAKPYIGVSVLDVSQENLIYGVPEGIAVQSVTEGSPAEEGGLQTGDIITAVNGTAMTSSEMVDLVQQSQVGDVLTLDVYRQGETLQLTVTVGQQIQSALPEEESVQPTTQQSQQSQQGWEDFPFEYFFGGRR